MQGSWKLVLPVGFVLYSLPLFLRVNGTADYIIDEEFHIPQGMAFCRKQFDVWDNKITTFPGLYLLALVLHPFNGCSVTGLRLLSLAGAGINILLMYKIRRRTLAGTGGNAYAAHEAITLSVLPPLYFFSHLYYTDTLSLTMVLLFYNYWQQEAHLPAAVWGAASVLMRQTNIVWVCMCCGITILDTLVQQCTKTRPESKQQIRLFGSELWLQLLGSPQLVCNCILRILAKCCFYASIILPFIGFICINGSIVVGDKSAHEASLHLPQLFYFTIFAAGFGISNTLRQLRFAFGLLRRNLLLTLVGILLIATVVHFNTVVHPYLLADNRHYTFYVWSRLYGRFWWFRYAMSPIYLLALVLLCCGLRHMPDSFKLMFPLSLLLVLCFQRLLELRYFLVPYVLFRLHTRPARKGFAEWLELGVHLLLNVVTFYVYFTKVFYWQNYRKPQRIIW
ncbi:putative Dol-P-Glc:Glc(2)Man(9)GlcNAc(2)-PP-Dol alpha-1,2-glucosyltransferase [Drosophila grimshawi]|uniref:Dol-P-Glc:Glc(2)Man(9)GlcNAc(2)-PP-Dol alpha-1,2-glucosyltransferase n=1 Tax=Drosophila grimshawi TaxID=7222 RepID=B4J2W4_DROGR|nr:putative Dol-P-Glc:Glc(2)Man(9)GlcNAc(2)-PP-Dol alpha-1,2-glucosyltransferase [Drosophila grimshawi]EDV97134.1 GH14834 [Drosophila grimshawi]